MAGNLCGPVCILDKLFAPCILFRHLYREQLVAGSTLIDITAMLHGPHLVPESLEPAVANGPKLSIDAQYVATKQDGELRVLFCLCHNVSSQGHVSLLPARDAPLEVPSLFRSASRVHAPLISDIQ